MCQTVPMAPAKRTKQMDFYVYVDTVVFTINPDRAVAAKDRLEVLVMQRPERSSNKWALPGGLVGDDEKLEETAIRKVSEETGITLKQRDLHQVGAYGNPDRDDRFRAIAIAYMALVPHPGDIQPRRHSDEAAFIPIASFAIRECLSSITLRSFTRHVRQRAECWKTPALR